MIQKLLAALGFLLCLPFAAIGQKLFSGETEFVSRSKSIRAALNTAESSPRNWPAASAEHPPQGLTTRYLFIVTTDGLRWQEVFGGADSVLLFDPLSRQRDTGDVAERFWAPTATERRAALMPFVWSTLVAEGQLYGNRQLGSKVDVANRYAFSYPGYNELFTGRPDNLRVFCNAKLRNPNKNIFGFFQEQRRLQGQVAAFTSWDAFPYILNAKKSRIPVLSGKRNRKHCRHDHPHEGGFDDPFTYAAAMDYAREKHPHVLYIGLNSTDLTGHQWDYPAHLEAAHRLDQYLAEIWAFIQSDSMYRNNTTLLITTDHGRGGGSVAQWGEHNRKLRGSAEIWMAAIGPDTPALGEVAEPMQLWQKQFAQTATHLLGLQFRRSRKVGHAVAPIYGMWPGEPATP
jgi:hypothetical protein